MRQQTVSGGWVVAAVTAAVLAMVSLPSGAATKTSEKPAAKPASKKPAAGSTTPKAKKPAADRPDPETLAPVDSDAEPAGQDEQMAEAPAPTERPAAVTTQPAIEAQVPTSSPAPVAVVPAASAKPQPAATPVAAVLAAKAAPAKPSAENNSQRIGLGKATVLGIVEGLTEYLPVSSTGHLILTSYWLGLAHETDERSAFGGRKIEASAGVDSFEIVIQLGAILAVLGLYRKRVGQMIRGLMGRNPNGLRLAMLLLVAFVPAAAIGFLFHKKVEQYLFGPMPVAIALAVGGVLMIVVEYFFWRRPRNRIHAAIQTRALVPVGSPRADSTGPMVNVKTTQQATSRFTKIETMVFWQAAAIGFAQCLAMWPGTSRSMITIVAALVVGLDMAAAAEFSFLLALPTLTAATMFSGLKHRHELMAATGVSGLLVGLIVSGIVAALAVKWFVGFLTRRGLMPFGVYRIIAAVFLMLYFLG